MQRLPLRRAAVASALATAVALAVAGCADDLTADEVRELGYAQLSAWTFEGVPDSDLDPGPEAASCVGESMVDDLGANAALETAGVEDVSSLPEERQDAVVAAIDDCVSGDAFADWLVDALFAPVGSEADTPELESCIATIADGRVGALEVMSPTELETFMSRLDRCPADDLVVAIVRTGAAGASVPGATIDCVTAALPGGTTFGTFRNDPAALESSVRAAAAACGVTG